MARSVKDVEKYIRPSYTAGIQPPCRYCVEGHRRICGIHVPTQRKGMIEPTPCEAIYVAKGGEPNQTETFKGGPGRQWHAYVDGEMLRDKRGVGRGFAYAANALKAARKASQEGGCVKPRNMPARRARRRARAIARELGLYPPDYQNHTCFRIKRHGGYEQIIARLAQSVPEQYSSKVVL